MGHSKDPIGNSIWHGTDSDFGSHVREMLSSIDDILLGRVTYEGFASYWLNSSDPEANVKENAAAEVAKLERASRETDSAIFLAARISALASCRTVSSTNTASKTDTMTSGVMLRTYAPA